MNQCDYDEFSAIHDTVAGLFGKAPDGAQKALFFRLLAQHSLAEVRAGFEAHLRDPQRGRFAPLPADILAQIQGAAAADGRPEVDEAWAIAIRAADEADTVVWTREMCQAWGACRLVFEGGDQIGARMAFKSAYTRLVAAARAARDPVHWEASLGSDPGRRDDALRIGVDAGRLPVAMLPAPATKAVGLLEMERAHGCPDHVRARLQELRQAIAERALQFTDEGRDAAARRRTERLKEAARAAVDRFGVGA